jgi:hypothetical protein
VSLRIKRLSAGPPQKAHSSIKLRVSIVSVFYSVGVQSVAIAVLMLEQLCGALVVDLPFRFVAMLKPAFP